MTQTQKKIEVLGPGCTRCKETFRVVQHVIEQSWTGTAGGDACITSPR